MEMSMKLCGKGEVWEVLSDSVSAIELHKSSVLIIKLKECFVIYEFGDAQFSFDHWTVTTIYPTQTCEFNEINDLSLFVKV